MHPAADRPQKALTGLATAAATLMDLHHLREFAAIAELRSFSKAARHLHLAQPPLSRHIRQLEDELGVRLFVRAATGVNLTREGAVLLEQARVVLADTAAFVDLARRAQLGLSNTLRVAMAPGLCEVVNRVRMHLADRSAEVTIDGTDIASAAQYEALRRRAIDVGVLRQVVDNPEIQTETLFSERFVVIISDANPLAKRRSLRLAQLRDYRLLLQDRDWAALAHHKILSLYLAAGITPDVVMREATPGNQASMLAVASGGEIALALQGNLTRSYQPVSGVAIVPLDEPGAEFEVQVAWRQGESSRIVCEFLNAARELFPKATPRSGKSTIQILHRRGEE